MFDWESHFSSVDGESGFSTDRLSKKDLKLFRSVLSDRYRSIVAENNPNLVEIVDIENYHLISEEVNHSNLWALKTFKTGNRVLDPDSFEKLLQTDFFKSLNDYYCSAIMKDDENISKLQFAQTVMFRLVRPLPFNDIGDLHSDKWFWDLAADFVPEGCRRIKFWVSLFNDGIKTGFRFVPSSQKLNYAYDSRKSEFGLIKPVFDETRHNLEIESFESEPGGFVIFHDNLLHGGEVIGNKTRVSCEFTILVR